MVAAVIAGVGAVAGAGASLAGSSQAAGASKKAADNNFRQYLTTRADLNPYNLAGQSALPGLMSVANAGPTGGGPDYVSQAAGMVPLQMTQAQLEQTPGYQFTLSQGLKSVQNAAAARGLGVSGAALKGAGDYATGLANKTYLDQFNVAQQRFSDALGLNTAQQGNITNQFNRLNALGTLGANAGAQTGTIGASLSNAAGNFLQQGGLASAAGTAGVGNAIAGAGNNFLGQQMLQQFLQGSGQTVNFGPATQGQIDRAFGPNSGTTAPLLG